MSKSKTILFVDDDRDFLVAQSAFFRFKGYQVITAESTQEAASLVETSIPDMIFMDLMMEHYDSGLTLSYALKKKESLAQVPIVMLSGVASATGRRFDRDSAALKEWANIDRFVDKPVTCSQLLQIVEEKLGPSDA